jgi:hypothetical protein
VVAAPDSSRTVHAMDQARLPKTKAAGGRRIGAIIGGASGLAFGVLFGLLIDALSEGEGGGGLDGAGQWVAWVGGTTVAGMLGGGLVGTIIGSAIPAEHPETPAELRREEKRRWDRRRPISSAARKTGPVVSITLEGSGGFPTRDGSRAGAGAVTPRRIGPAFRSGWSMRVLYSEPRLSTGLVARGAVSRPVRGLAVGNDYWTNDLSLTGGSVGLVGDAPPRGAFQRVVGRYHFTLQRSTSRPDLNLVTLAAGVASW